MHYTRITIFHLFYLLGMCGGAWLGAIKKSSHMSISVTPGEHRACIDWPKLRGARAEFVHFTVEAGKTYYYLIRCFNTASGAGAGTNVFEFGPADRDEALFLIASDPQSVAKPSP